MTLLRSVVFPIKATCKVSARCCHSSRDIRNIGILAHIDAGKTTTTERMLFYAGKTRSLGEVHHGNTITDYLTQERERGITICSSAVTFPWKSHRINLLDTPGHIDFTMEVEQSLYAVDGVVVVLDGTAGVEAQTLTVWRQAEKHQLPKIVFVNKMDRPDANFESCVKDVEQKLDTKPVCLHYPLKDENGNLSIIDVTSMRCLQWDPKTLGRSFTTQKLENELLSVFQEKRNVLIDQLSGVDDDLANAVIANEGFENITSEQIRNALRKATCREQVVPVFLGSAYKNVGVQCLMDGVVNYLPAPSERNQLYRCFNNDFVGKVFKIVHDKQRGPLTLVRVFGGELNKGMRVTSTRGGLEIVSKIYEPLADEYREVNVVKAGDVVICSGLKGTVTGDLLISSATSLQKAQKRYENILTKQNILNSELHDSFNEIFSTEPRVPDAVYFCSIEPPSLSTQNAMELALRQLQREDPSLRVTYDAVTGQTVLGGMGELHMDIIKSRMLTEYKIEVDLGALQIAYKEMIDFGITDTLRVEKDIAGSKQSVTITLELLTGNNELFSLDKSSENSANLSAIRPRMLQVIRKGAISALERGPRVGGQVIDTQIKLHNIQIGRGTADSFIMAATAQCVQKILTESGTRLLEPIMAIEIVTPSERVSSVLADLSRRRAVINDVQPKGANNKMIFVNAPLAELAGYSTALRRITSGTASMSMQPAGFANMNPNDELVAVRRTQGLE